MNYVKYIIYLIFILVFKTYNENNEKILVKYKEIYNLKLDLLFMDDGKYKNCSYNLIYEPNNFEEHLRELTLYLHSVFEHLWKSPKSISTILLNANKNDIKDFLANFFVNNFYDNISSLKGKDEHLIYIITLLLKKEFNSLKKNNEFLSKSSLPFIFEKFFDKKEIKLYLQTILFDVVKKVENVNFIEFFSFQFHGNKNVNQTLKSENNDNIKINMDDFMNNYLYKGINKEELEKKILENDNDEIKIFLQKLIQETEKNPTVFLNEEFCDKIYSSENDLLDYFLIYFNQVIDIVDTLFDSILKNIGSVPYSIKCLCKIVSVLADKKSQEIETIDKKSFLFSIFFYNLVFPALMSPFHILLDEYKNSQISAGNLNILFTILKNICTGNLFKENNYTPFNWYIIEKMPQIFELYKKLCNVNLPNFIEQLIGDQLPEEYEYDYFKENPEERFIYRNICFNIDELYCLVCNMEKCKGKLSMNEKVSSKIISKKELIETIKNEKNSKKDLEKSDKQINYFLLTSIIVNENFGKINNIKNRKYFMLKELKSNKTKKEIIQNKIIKIKNVFFALLYNCQTFSKNILKKNKSTDIKSILNEIKTLPSINIDNAFIPTNFYINYLIENLSDLPDDFRENDYEKLLDEMESVLTESLQQMNSNEITSFSLYLKETEKEKLHYETIKTIRRNIKLDKITLETAEKQKIILDLTETDKKLVKFFLKLINDKSKFSKIFEIEYKKKKPIKISITINSFIKNFPKAQMIEIIGEFDIFELMKKEEIPQIIYQFFLMVKQYLTKESIIEKEIQEEVYDKIYDYLMEQLNDKLFPNEPSKKDIEIFHNCYKHAWIRLSNLYTENNYILEDYLFDSNIYLTKFEKEKSPRKKLLCINEIFNYIYKFAQINGIDEVGAEEEITLLLYIVVKSRLQKLYSNCKYTELFTSHKGNNNLESNQLLKIIAICEKIEALKFEDFNNIEKSYYIYYCDMAKKGVFNN